MYEDKVMTSVQSAQSGSPTGEGIGVTRLTSSVVIAQWNSGSITYWDDVIFWHFAVTLEQKLNKRK